MIFAKVTGQPFSEVLKMHPRDMDTWQELLEAEASEHRMQGARDSLKQQMG